MSFSSRSIVLFAVFAGSALAACSSSSPTLAPATNTQTGDITVFPDAVYVGVDDSGKALSAVPIALTGATGAVTWTSATTGVATATGGEKNGLITAVKAGSSVVTVKAGTKTATVKVTVNTYPAADSATGKTEFTTAKCDGCHNANGPDISTSDLAKHTDDQIMAAILQGTNPEGGDIEGMTPHKFTATKAILAYVRAIPAMTDTPVQDK